MTSRARQLTAIALAGAVILERAGYYAMRVALVPRLRSAAAHVSLDDVFLITSISGLVGMVVGAGIAFVVGPWAVVIAGLAIEMLGIVALPWLPPELVPIALVAVHGGRGVAWPATLAAAADALAGAREPARNGLFIALFLCVDLGAFLGPLAAALSPREPAWSFAPGMLLTMLALVVVAAGAGLTRAERRAVEPSPGGSLGATAIFLVLVAVPWSTSFTQAQLALPFRFGGLDVPAGWSTLTSVVTTLLGPAVLLVFIVMHGLGKWRVPTTRIVGVGLALFGLGQLAFVPADTSALALPIFGTICAGVSGLLVPLALSRITGDLPHRLRTAAIALFVALTQLPALFVRGYETVRVMAWAGSIAALVVGAAMVIAGGRLERLLREEDRAPDEPRAF